MRPEVRLRAWLVAGVLATAGASLLALRRNDVTFSVALLLVAPLGYVAALDFEDRWRAEKAPTKAAVVLCALLALGTFWLVVGVDRYGRPVDGVWVRSWMTLAVAAALMLGWLVSALRESRSRRRRRDTT